METHYFNMEVNSINRDKLKKIEWEKRETLFKNAKEIPEWENIMVFQWVFSQNFKKWEVSRNWYKYDQKGWVVDNYARLPLILWQHNDSYGWIGFTKELWLDSKWNLVWLFWVDLDMLEERNAKQVRNWYVTSVSTWATTLEDWFEDVKTWKIYTRDEAEAKFWFDAIIDALWVMKDRVLNYVVTKAELVENSLVTIWSNYWAIAKSVNTLSDEMKKKAEELKLNKSSKDEILLDNYKSNMSKAVIETKDTDVTPEAEVEVVETPVVVETEVETPVEPNNVELLNNKLAELEKSFDTYKNEVEKELNDLREKNKNIDAEARKNIIANAPQIVKGNKVDWVNSIEDFKNKYSK